MTTNPKRYCIRCGEQGPYRSDKATRCTSRDVEAEARRKEWAKEYHAARSRAVSRLIKAHHLQFKNLLDEEQE